MRWPFRRRPAEVIEAASPPPSPVTRPIGAHPGRRAWQTLPPLVPVVARPRITVAAPDVTMTRSLLHRPAAPIVDARPVGRVDGLAEVLPALDVDHPAPPVSLPSEAPRPVRAVPRPVERPPLTAATPEYVGEAREAAEPYRAPAWLRALSSGPVVDPLFGVMLPGPAQPARPIATPPPVRMPTTDGAPPRRPLRPRGRLGLGAPLRPDAGDAPDAEPEPAGPQISAAPAGTPALPFTIPSPVDDFPSPGGAPAVVEPSENRPAQSRHVQPRHVQPRLVQPRLVQPRFVESAETAPSADQVPLTHPPLSEMRRPDSAERSAVPPPAAIARDVVAATGVDLDRVLVHRGPDVERQATQLGAAAFAADDTVHLGSAAGHDDGPEARALIAHELVHIAQQRRSGGTVADETSAEGVRLEAEAVAVEQAVRESRPLPALVNPRPVDSQLVHPQVMTAPSVEPRPADRLGAGRPIGAPSYPAFAGPVPERVVVRGRVQRRPLDLGHAPAVAATAQPAAQAPAAAPQTPASPPATAPTPAPTPAVPATPPPTVRERFSSLGEGLATDMGDMVLASWSLENGHQASTRGSGNGGGPGTGTGGNTNGGDSRQEQFNRLAQPALDRLNEERSTRGEHPLAQLPQEEEERIWRQVDQGGGGGLGAGSGQHQEPPPIRNWHDLGTAAAGDFSNLVGSSFGIDVAEIVRADAATAAGAATGTGAAAGAHPDQHKKIEPDDIDLDELGHRLYDRIRSRLRLELLLDRERAGLLSDFR